MAADTARTRPDRKRRPWVLTTLKTSQGVPQVVAFIGRCDLLVTD